MIKIINLTEHYAVVGGLRSYIRSLACALSEFTNFVFSSDVDENTFFERRFSDFFELIQLLNRISPQFLFVHNSRKLLFIAFFYRLLFNKKVIILFFVHTFLTSEASKGFFSNFIEKIKNAFLLRFFSRFPDQVIGVCNYSLKSVQILEDKSCVLYPNYVHFSEEKSSDLEKFDSFFEKGCEFYLVIANFVYEKKSSGTIDAIVWFINWCKSMNIEKKLYVLGDGPFLKNALQVVEKNNAENLVKICGRTDSRVFLKKSKAIIYISYFDCFPNVISESIFHDKIIVSNLPGGVGEILSNKNSYVVNSKEDFIRALNSIEFGNIEKDVKIKGLNDVKLMLRKNIEEFRLLLNSLAKRRK